MKPDKNTQEKVGGNKGTIFWADEDTHRGFVQLESCLKVRSESWRVVELLYTVWLCTDLGPARVLVLWFLILIS